MIVDCGTRLNQQAQDFSLRTLSKPSAQRSWIPLTIFSTERVNMCYLQKLCRVLFCTVKVMLGTAFCRKQAFCRE